MLFFYLAVVITALYYVSKILGPEMIKPPRPKAAPKPDSFDISQYNDPDNRTKRLETLLVEKNKNIEILQTELRIYHVKMRGFDKVKTLLEEEIHRLREQNRIFRSELGLPTVQTKENSIT